MAATDVVKHDLTLLGEREFDWAEDVEPVPFPSVRGEPREEANRVEAKPPVTTRVTGTELTSAPYRSVGKMLLAIGGKNLGGTGWVVAPRAFITAGHCVYYEEYGGWITKAALCPRYDTECVKSYKVTTVYALKGWVESGDHRYDMAACVVSENFATTEPPLAFDTGLIPGLHFTAIGYPIKPIAGCDFNGKRMWKSVGDRITLTNYAIWAENNLTGGASGGPWCETDNNYVISGINSNREDDPNTLESPMFDNGFDNLYNAVKNL
jgi:V8-like Glu-specific endopeptidase